MWHIDLAVLVEGLDEWSRTDENIARLVDREDYWLNSEYHSWITDPDDPEVKKAAEERKRKGIKPPPRPLLMPVAQRPPEIHNELATAIGKQIQAREPEERAPGETKVSIAEFRRMRRQ